jgi:acyl carrier protein
MDWATFAATFTAERPRPLLDDLPQVRAERAAEEAAAPATALDRLAGMTAEERESELRELVRRTAAAVLGHDDHDQIRAARPFRELGFDSLTVVELRNRLRTRTGLPIATTVVFDHPTPAALATHLAAQVRGAASQPSEVDVMAELDRIEAAIAAGEDRTRSVYAKRLRAMAMRLGAAAADAEETGEFDPASDDDLFAALDTELGLS